MFNTIEDALEHLVGLQEGLDIKIESTDHTILNSIGRQVFRQKALTDRQRNVIVEKLNYYGVKFNDKLRMPLREIDREKYIKIVDSSDVPIKRTQYEEFKTSWTWIAIKFPFNKTTILALEEVLLKHRKYHIHPRGSHIHYLKLTEMTVYDIVNKFKNKDFTISDDVLNYYAKVSEIIDNPKKYMPYADNTGVYNLEDSKLELLNAETNLDLKLIKDRSIKYGLYSVDIDIDNSSLENRIVNRKKINVIINPKEFSIQDVMQALFNLNRLPVLCFIDDNVKTLERIYSSCPYKKHSVLFRLENKDNEISPFNTFIKNNNMNVSLDNNPDIVYIKSNAKPPKPLIQSDWSAGATIRFDASYQGHRQTIFKSTDLNIAIDELNSVLNRNLFEEI